MQNVVERVAAGLLMEMVAQAERCDLNDLNHVVDQVTRELSGLCITRPRTFLVRSKTQWRVLIVGQLNDLLRRGMVYIEWGGPTNPWLVAHVRKGTESAVARMLAIIRK